ncbi:MAG TPA: carboxynorspermidine decarboxylase [Sedimentisphaerales bacterium]|nr:carboxynorspermidine decarboxylase [Sedimentisphaerales bacterium]
MAGHGIPRHIIEQVPSPCYMVNRGALRWNLELLSGVQMRTGCTILLALKGFAMFRLFPEVKQHLPGISASSLNEARLGHEEFGGLLHVVCPAYREDEFDSLLSYADHIVFNSLSQWSRFKDRTLRSDVKAGIRVNLGYSEVKVDIYNPCGRFSRLGVPVEQLLDADLEGVSGLHFHTMCEQNSDTLERTVGVFEDRLGNLIDRMEWVNFGGGHHITRPDYDVERLCRVLAGFRSRHKSEVFLEPGEAIALNTGVLIASVLDITWNGMDIALLDTSAAAHMPDVLEMPYRPVVAEAGQAGTKKHTYRLGGTTCLAGDVIGDYSFDSPLKPGDRLTFLDMAHYTMVKNNTFNGVNLPSIASYDPDSDKLEVVRTFGYEDYRNRLS